MLTTLCLQFKDEVIMITDFPKNCTGVLWDVDQPNVFVAYDEKTCVTFVFVQYSVNGMCFSFCFNLFAIETIINEINVALGDHVVHVGKTTLLTDQIPMMLFDGDLSISSASGGQITTITLATHTNAPATEMSDQLSTLLKLRKYVDAWELCRQMDDASEWHRFGRAAVADLDVSLAIRVFRKCGDAAMVLALEDVLHVEDVNYMSGTCAVLLDMTDKAKSFFAKSVNPHVNTNLKILNMYIHKCFVFIIIIRTLWNCA